MRPAYRRALAFLAIPMALIWIYQLWPRDAAAVTTAPDASPESISVAEQRLERLRQLAATIPAKEEILREVSAELAVREQGLIVADTGAQAQAELLQILRRLGGQESPAISIQATQLGAIAPLSAGSEKAEEGEEDYGLATVTVQITCRIEQLVNFLAALAAQPELISTRDLQIQAASAQDKTVRVRLTVGGVVSKDLLSESRAGAPGL